jgi:hypothetical protein
MVGEHLSGEVSRLVGYTSDVASFADYKVVIVPSDFFNEGVYGTYRTIPGLPLKNIEGVPFLFGTPGVERVRDTIVVHADLVASAYFLLSRYEELLHRDIRDGHGRFPGRKSLPYQAGFIDRPVVDEYGKLIRKWLNMNGVKIDEHKPFIRKINLTHDVDAPFSCRTWRNVARHIVSGRNPVSAIRAKYNSLPCDPFYTFPRMFQQNKILQHSAGENRCRTLLFFKAGGKTKNDKPHYDLYGKDMKTLFELCREQEATIGLHSSYHAGIEPSRILSEKKNLETACGTEVRQNRHHFLSSREPEDMECLEKAGITDDYTMGYADVAGFRLGTSLPVRYIKPATCRLSLLTLHPLTIMDGTLFEPDYMNLTAGEAEEYCMRLIHNTRNVSGELTLLWHNTSFVESNSGYLRELYGKILNCL